MIDGAAFTEGMARLTAAFPNKLPSQATVELYRRSLGARLSTEQFAVAVDLALVECEFFPTIAKLMKYAPERGNRLAANGPPYSVTELHDTIGHENVRTFLAPSERYDMGALYATWRMLERTGELAVMNGMLT